MFIREIYMEDSDNSSQCQQPFGDLTNNTNGGNRVNRVTCPIPRYACLYGHMQQVGKVCPIQVHTKFILKNVAQGASKKCGDD